MGSWDRDKQFRQHQTALLLFPGSYITKLPQMWRLSWTALDDIDHVGGRVHIVRHGHFIPGGR